MLLMPWPSTPLTNKIYVADLSGSSVTVIDGATDTTSNIPIAAGPVAIAVNASTNMVFASNLSSAGTVSVINGATGQFVKTVTVGNGPQAIAANPVTNKIYVANVSDGTVSVIDGATLEVTHTVIVGAEPDAIAINPVTNKIYVSSTHDNTVTVIDGVSNQPTVVDVHYGPTGMAVNPLTNTIYIAGQSNDTLTILNGANNSTSSIAVGNSPQAVAVNQVTNQIYVVNNGDNTVTVVDGDTLNTSSVTVGTGPALAVANAATNKIYVLNGIANSVTMIDGVTHTTATVPIGRLPRDLALNPVTDRLYAANLQDNTVTVIGGAPSSTPLQFVSIVPCRVVDTRDANGPFGGPSLSGGTSRSFPIPQGACDIPDSAAAYSLNVTVVPHGQLGYLTIWPTGEDQPVVSTMNSLDGRIKANAAIVPAGYQGGVTVYATNTTDVVLDLDGYFTAPSAESLQFYPLPPCRVFDTRKPNGPLGGPSLVKQTERDFPVLDASACNIPSSAEAYSMNFTVVPSSGGIVGYLTAWPTGEQRPVVSTLNDLTGTVVANAAIVVAGTSGEIAAYATDNTDLVGDINGYFAAPGTGGLSLYGAAPCRVLDTRQGNGGFDGVLSPPVNVTGSICAPPSQAKAYVFNATVLPFGALGYLTLWPDGENQPVVSTLNALDGAITSNMAIVPSSNGKVDAYASGETQLVLDLSSYFAP